MVAFGSRSFESDWQHGVMIPIMSILHSIAGVICVRLFASIESWGTLLSSGQSLFEVSSCCLCFIFAGAKIFRRRIGDVFDVFTMCTVTTLLFARIACIFSGCCYGMLLPGSESVRWPTRELELVFYIILLIVLYRKKSQCSHKGEIWPIYMISYGVFRFVVEWMREEKGYLGILPLWAYMGNTECGDRVFRVF